MKQEDKDLQLLYLSASLLHGVEIVAENSGIVGTLVGLTRVAKKEDWLVWLAGVLTPFKLDEVKPYLRSMDDMTKEERNYYEDRWFEGYHCKHGDDMVSEGEIPCYIDWLLENHFNYMLPEHLYIKVTKENNPYKD